MKPSELDRIHWRLVIARALLFAACGAVIFLAAYDAAPQICREVILK